MSLLATDDADFVVVVVVVFVLLLFVCLFFSGIIGSFDVIK